MKNNFIFLIVFSLIFPTYCYAKNNRPVETLIFMRHGERPALELGQLNCKGLNRSLRLPKVINTKYGKPDYIFAPNPYLKISDKLGYYYYVTALTSIQPTAIQFSLPLNVIYSYFQNDETIEALLSPKYHHSMLFVSWEHVAIYNLVKKIINMLDPDSHIEVPWWTLEDYDSLYVLVIDWRKHPPKVTFIHDHEELDNQPSDCPVTLKASKQINKKIRKTYIIIPEGELAPIPDQLCCKGLNRALALTNVLLEAFPPIDKFYIPIPILVTPTNNHFFLTTMTTLEPTAIYYQKNFSVLRKYDPAHLMKELNQLSASIGTIAIGWPTEHVAELAKIIFKAHGGNPKIIPDPVPNNDTIYKIEIYKHLRRPVFSQVRENLNHLSEQCP